MHRSAESNVRDTNAASGFLGDGTWTSFARVAARSRVERRQRAAVGDRDAATASSPRRTAGDARRRLGSRTFDGGDAGTASRRRRRDRRPGHRLPGRRSSTGPRRPTSPDALRPVTQGASSGGPCLSSPRATSSIRRTGSARASPGTAANGENLFELRLHVANQIEDLVVYTTNRLDDARPMWDALRTHSPTEAMTLTVRGGVLAGGALQGEALGTSTPMGVAPVQATGAIVYWTTDDTTTGTAALKGFSPGDESVELVLARRSTPRRRARRRTCIGCHTATPDGELRRLHDDDVRRAAVDRRARAHRPGRRHRGIRARVPGAPAAPPRSRAGTSAPWRSRPRTGQTGIGALSSRTTTTASGTNIVLSWIDVEATSAASASGTLARNGDSQLAGAPAWSHDGQTVAYVSTNRVCTGRLGNCTPQYDSPPDPGSRAALYTVPYAGGAGGTATPRPGRVRPSLQSTTRRFRPTISCSSSTAFPTTTTSTTSRRRRSSSCPRAGGPRPGSRRTIRPRAPA